MSVVSRVETMPASLTVLTDANQVDALRREWLDLLSRSGTNEITLTPDWIATWWQVFGSSQGRELRIGLIREGDQLIGLAPLLRRRHWHRRVIPFRRLEFLASGEPEADS